MDVLKVKARNDAPEIPESIMLANIELCVQNYVAKTQCLGTLRSVRKESRIRICLYNISFTDVKFEPKYESCRTNVNIPGHHVRNATHIIYL